MRMFFFWTNNSITIVKNDIKCLHTILLNFVMFKRKEVKWHQIEII